MLRNLIQSLRSDDFRLNIEMLQQKRESVGAAKTVGVSILVTDYPHLSNGGSFERAYDVWPSGLFNSLQWSPTYRLVLLENDGVVKTE